MGLDSSFLFVSSTHTVRSVVDYMKLIRDLIHSGILVITPTKDSLVRQETLVNLNAIKHLGSKMMYNRTAVNKASLADRKQLLGGFRWVSGTCAETKEAGDDVEFQCLTSNHQQLASYVPANHRYVETLHICMCQLSSLYQDSTVLQVWLHLSTKNTWFRFGEDDILV